jgi:hypothetical protein
MEILSRKGSRLFKFKVKKSFRWAGFPTVPGQELELRSLEAASLISSGRIEPADVPPTATYICIVTEVILPGREKAFKAKFGEKVILKREDAVRLMMAREVIPLDSAAWKPYQIELRKPGTSQGRR